MLTARPFLFSEEVFVSVQSLHDGVYISASTPNVNPTSGNPNLPSAIVGSASWGVPNTPYPFTNAAQLKDAFGEITQALHDLGTCATTYLQACNASGKSGNCYGIRVTDTTDTAATITAKDIVTPTAGNVLVITGISTGVRGNGGTMTTTAAASSTSTQPVYNITLTIPFGQPELFQNIIAWKNTGGTFAYDAPTFVANAKSAINAGLSYARAASKYWIASSPTTLSAALPLLGTAFSAAGGSDGSSVTSAQLLGVDGVSGRTGIFAERGIGVGQFAISGLTDFTVGPSFSAYAAPRYKMFVGPSFPLGTSTTSALSIKQTNGANSIYQAVIKDWVLWFDYTINQARLVSPEGVALGGIASRSPEQSPGNQPETGFNSFLLATELTGPISDTELDALAGAGIIAIGPMVRNSSLIGLVGGQNASGISGQDGVNYTRLTGFLIGALRNIANPFVNSLQSQQDNDPTRRLFKKAIDGFLISLKTAGQIDSFNTTCDKTNNTASTIPAGQLNALVLVRYLATVRYINIGLVAGVGVTMNVSTSQQVTQAI